MSETKNDFDQFADFNEVAFENDTLIEIRVDSVRGRKKVTTVSGFSTKFYKLDDIKKMAKILKQKCACASTVGQVTEEINPKKPFYFTLQGDHAKVIKEFLVQKKYANENEIEVRGIADLK